VAGPLVSQVPKSEGHGAPADSFPADSFKVGAEWFGGRELRRW